MTEVDVATLVSRAVYDRAQDEVVREGADLYYTDSHGEALHAVRQ